MVMHEINKSYALYDAVWTPKADSRAASATSSPSCTAGGSTDDSPAADEMDLEHLMKLVPLVKALDDLCQSTRARDAQLVSLRNQALSLLQVWTRTCRFSC